MMKKKHHFQGWVTKNDILCMDGVTIKQDAFKHNNGTKVPLVWNHDYNSPTNVLGNIELVNKKEGTYGYGYFNDTEEGNAAKELVLHGDITSMSVGAHQIKRQGANVIHGTIYEVSLVMAGANPGAKIESDITHSADGDNETAIIYTDNTFSVDDSELIQNEDTMKHSDEEEPEMEDKTIGDIMDTLTEEQEEAVMALLASVIESQDENDEEDEGDEEEMKHNVFNGGTDTAANNDVLKHSMFAGLQDAINQGAPSLKKVLASRIENEPDGDTLKHGINSIEMLFPEAAHSATGNEPVIYKDPNTSYAQILNGVTKSPFSRVKVLFADLTEDEARAKGYIKGTFKKNEYFSLIKRVTTPCTIYKKQKLDRDDIVDITDFNVVAFMNREMDMMLREELARAILVGDGRDVDADDKINESNIRPIISDNEFFTIHKTYTNPAGFMEAVIKALAEYRGSGRPNMYIDPTLLADVKLLKGTDGRFLFGEIPSNTAIATRLGLGEIVETTFMIGKGALIVNLKDYTLGASKGGQITNFDDFDIDFNQYKYLIETRLSGALTMPKSAIHLALTKGAAANDTDGGMTYGKKMTDPKPASDKGGDWTPPVVTP